MVTCGIHIYPEMQVYRSSINNVLTGGSEEDLDLVYTDPQRMSNSTGLAWLIIEFTGVTDVTRVGCCSLQCFLFTIY